MQRRWSEDELQRHRSERKLVIRQWNKCVERVNAPEGPETRVHDKSDSSSIREELDDRFSQWLQANNTTVAASRASTDLDSECLSDLGDARARDASEGGDEEDDKTLRTVGQIRRAYKVRARREESLQEQRAVLAARERRERLRSIEGVTQKAKRYSAATAIASPPDVVVVDEKAPDSRDSESSTPAAMTELESSDAAFVCCVTSLAATDRDVLLRDVRRELSRGRVVSLRADQRVVRDATTGELKLFLQQLCTQSLLFCRHDQSVVPDVQGALVTLELQPRCSRV
ncbi:hypothetical protein PINS_up010012 [Pythium insidiosum]|nr:hypothetical protein PINS_up010012 [Pythium insidiosum]